METVNQLLLDFIKAMNIWEVDAAKILKFPFSTEEEYTKAQEKARKELRIVFSTYCTEKEMKKKYGRIQSLSYGRKLPEYSLETQTITKTEKINKNKYVVYTKYSDTTSFDFRYTIIYKKASWKLDKKERFSVYKNDWVMENL